MLSPNVKEELLEASSHLRAALRNASTNEKPYICKTIASMLMTIETIEQTENLMDKFGQNSSFGPFQF
jgi:hypothetical protein